MTALTLTLIGGPTMLIEADGFRLITDPTFDAPGEYQLSYVTLTKTLRRRSIWRNDRVLAPCRGAPDSRHIGLNARSSSTSISSEPPPLIPWATRSVAS
jgi:hypothetical protein